MRERPFCVLACFSHAGKGARPVRPCLALPGPPTTSDDATTLTVMSEYWRAAAPMRRREKKTAVAGRGGIRSSLGDKPRLPCPSTGRGARNGMRARARMSVCRRRVCSWAAGRWPWRGGRACMGPRRSTRWLPAARRSPRGRGQRRHEGRDGWGVCEPSPIGGAKCFILLVALTLPVGGWHAATSRPRAALALRRYAQGAPIYRHNNKRHTDGDACGNTLYNQGAGQHGPRPRLTGTRCVRHAPFRAPRGPSPPFLPAARYQGD